MTSVPSRAVTSVPSRAVASVASRAVIPAPPGTAPATADGADGDLDQKIAALRQRLADLGQVLVAFSGGVDSTYLLAEALNVLGDRAVALTAVSGTLPEAEYDDARALGQELGARHLLVDSNELQIDGYRLNAPNRCYFCKTELYDLCVLKAAELGIGAIADGCNLDDLGDYRPGRQAAAEHGIVSPLIEARMTKADVRAASARLGLRTARKAAFACLGSRFPYGTEITPERLSRIGACEQVLREQGFHQFRCRFHDTVVRIELAPGELPRLFSEPGLSDAVVKAMKAQGFLYVTVDLQGYRQGAMNEALTHVQSVPASALFKRG